MTDPDNAKIERATPALPAKDTFRLLIMDNVEHTDQLKSACKDAGHSVIAVHSIRKAFAFLDGRDHADLIICAAHLKDESMLEFLKQLRSNEIHKSTMFMVLNLAPGPIGVRFNDLTEMTGRMLGADAFLSMPVFDAAILIAEIKKLLPLVPLLEKDRLQKLNDQNTTSK